MPSTLVHLGIAGLLAAALLGDAFRPRTLGVVLVAVVVVDLDVFLGMVVLGAHRAAFHTLLWPTVVGLLLVYDMRIREASWLRARFGDDTPRTTGVTILVVVFAGIAPDLVTNGVNLFYPFHDQFYALNGRIQLSTERGLVQTFFEESARGSSGETQYYTGADPDPSNPGGEPAAERTFLVVDSGMQALIVVLGVITVTARLWALRFGDTDSTTDQDGARNEASGAPRSNDARDSSGVDGTHPNDR